MAYIIDNGNGIWVRLTSAVATELAEQNILTPMVVCKDAPSDEQFSQMLSGGGGDLSAAQAAACLRRLPEVMMDMLGLGHQVKIPKLGTFKLRAKGKFAKDGQPVEGSELTFKLSFLPCATWKKYLKNLQASIIRRPTRVPIIDDVDDAAGAARTGCITPGVSMKITGSDLKFNLLQSDEGVFFVEEGTGQVVRATAFLDNRGTRLTCGVPELKSGSTYILSVRKRFHGCKTLRIGYYQTPLTCN